MLLKSKHLELTKHRVDHTAESDRCRVCSDKGETVWHITSQCTPLAQREYKRRHDNVVRIVHWRFVESMTFKEVTNGMTLT